MTLDDCEVAFDEVLQSKTEAEFERAIAPLFEEYEILSIDFGRGSVFWRARIIETTIYKNISELDYPPAQIAKVGRLNDPRQPCFYISSRKETTIAEVDATEGQFVQLAGFKILNEAPIRLAVIGEYANVQKSGYMHFAGQDPGMAISKILNSMPRDHALKRIYIDRFFSSILSDPEAKQNEYFHSRALTKAIYARNKSKGIIFPSVRDRGGFNIGVDANASDKSFVNVSCIIVSIGKKRRFGVVDFELVKSAERLDEDWNFVWLDQDSPERIGMYNMTREEYLAATDDPDDRNALLKVLEASKRR